MDKKDRFSIIGGDRRNLFLANILAKDGYNVSTYGIESDELIKKVSKKSSLEEAVETSDFLIGPLPCSLDGETINCMYSDEKIYLKDIFKLMNKNQLFFAGFINEKVKQAAHTYNVFITDYFEREELAVLNCIPTAEGAIQIAMEELPVTIHGSNCLVLGFGRVGKILSRMLYGIGANVSVEARKHSDLAWVKSLGYEGIHLNDLEANIGHFDIIFNTIPALVLNTHILKEVKKDCLVIDLASKPGGVDFEAAKELGVKTNWALSLPGKVAPYTAANVIKSTIFNIINELGV